MTLCSFTFEQYIEKVLSFHGFAAFGVIVDGFTIDFAYRSPPQHVVFDALCETAKRLPDAIHQVTPCTVGNSWFTIINKNRYALVLHDKVTGRGIRVFVDEADVDRWPMIRNRCFKMTSKEGQDEQNLLREIRDAGLQSVASGRSW